MILLTGASGFIGTHLLTALINKYGTNNIVALTSKPIDNVHCIIHNNYSFNADIFIKNNFENIETIIHAGAFIPKNSKDSNWIENCNSNIVNTQKILNCKLPNLKNIIFLSTIDIYGNETPLHEKSIIDPVSLYGSSKLYCEKMIEVWAKENKKTYQILRIGHVYGPGEEKYQKLIPNTIRKILSDEPVELYGTGEDLRTLIYITDVVQAIINSINLPQKNEIINIVGNEVISVKKLIETIIKLCNKDIVIKQVVSNIPVRNLIFDNAKLITLLGPPKVSLEEGLETEIAYFKNL